jgi:eukaryotic-like serine/threonine-protein kinase
MTQAARERLVADRYSMDAILRQGRAGVVWRATDVVDGNPVAVEEIEPASESEPERNQRWSRIVQAAQKAAALEHPGVVKLLDVLLDDQRYFVVSELTEGLALSELLDRHGQLPWRRVARIGLELAEVLESGHRTGVVHGDLQPAHVLVTPDGAVKLAGFGLGPVVPPARPSPVPAPEQLRGEPAGPPADLWALGATMYAAVEGTGPFEGGPRGILYGGVRPASGAGALAGLLESLLDKAPERRPAAAEARERLREIVEHATPADPRVTRTTASTVTPPFITRPMRSADASTSVLGPAARSRAGGAVGRAGDAVGRAARAGAAAGRAARGRAGASAAARGWRAALDWALDPGRRGLVVGLGSTLLALLSFVLIVVLVGNPTGSSGQTQAAAPPVTTAAPAPTTTAAPPTTATPTTVAPVPAGWQVFADERSGYRIAYPASWEVVRGDDQTVEFHDRSTPTVLRVRTAQAPVPDPVAAQLQSSQQHAGFHQGSYQQTRLDPSNFQGRPGALLEFTFLGDDEQVFRADELGTNTPPTPGGPGWWVTIFVQSRDADWGVAQSLLRTALDSFVPPTN